MEVFSGDWECISAFFLHIAMVSFAFVQKYRIPTPLIDLGRRISCSLFVVYDPSAASEAKSMTVESPRGHPCPLVRRR